MVLVGVQVWDARDVYTFSSFFLPKTGSGPDAGHASPLYGSLENPGNQEVRSCNHSVVLYVDKDGLVTTQFDFL